jgi:hypothetical protein
LRPIASKTFRARGVHWKKREAGRARDKGEEGVNKGDGRKGKKGRERECVFVISVKKSGREGKDRERKSCRESRLELFTNQRREEKREKEKEEEVPVKDLS